MAKWIKYSFLALGWFIAGIVLAVVLAGLILQTEPARKKIASLAGEQSSEMINGNLTIGKIEGNFFNCLSLKNILLTFENDTLATIKELNASYSLWALRRRIIEVRSTEIIEPRFFPVQVNDSVWNFQQIIKPVPENTDTTRSSGFKTDLQLFRITGGFVKTTTADTLIPQEIRNLNTELSLFLSEEQQKLHLREFSFSSFRPGFRLNQLNFELLRDNHFIELKNVELQTAANQLHGNMDVKTDPVEKGSATFESPAVKLEEIRYFIPHIRIPATPSVTLDAQMGGDSIRATIELADQNQHIHIGFVSPNLPGFVRNPEDTELIYTITGKFGNVDLKHWLGNPALNYFLNGNLSVAGTGINPATAQVDVSGKLNNWVVKNRKLNELLFDINLKKGNLDGIVQGNGEFGKFSLKHSIKNILEIPEYRLDLTTHSLDLTRLTGISGLESAINMNATVTGKNYHPEKMKATANINVSHSRFQNVQFDTLFAPLHFKQKNLLLDTLFLKTPKSTLAAAGNYSVNSNSELRLTTVFSGLKEFNDYLPDSNLQTSGRLTARLWGKTGSFNLQSTLQLEEIHYNNYSLNELTLNATGQTFGNDILIKTLLLARGLEAEGLKTDTITAEIEGNRDSLFLDMNLMGERLNTHLQAGIVPGDKARINLAGWEIDYQNQHWALQQPPAIIEIGPSNYSVENFMLASGNSDIAQGISAHGKVSRAGDEDFNLGIYRLDVGKLSEWFGLEDQVAGLLDINLNLKGTADLPLITTNFSIDEAIFNGYKIPGFSGKMDYKQNRIFFETRAMPGDSGKLNLTASLPLLLRLDSLGVSFNNKDSISAQLSIENVSASALQAMDISDDFSGFFEADFQVSGTLESPLANGNFSINEAGYNEFEFYKISGNLGYLENQFSLKTEIVPAVTGRVDIAATVPLPFNTDSLRFDFNPKDPVNGSVQIRKFPLAVLQTMTPAGKIDGFLNGNLNISGTTESPNPTGSMGLQEASVEIKEYGIDYKDIALDMNFLEDKIVLDKLLVKSNDGNITGKGQIDFDSGFYVGKINESAFELKFNKFNPFNHRHFNMQLTGNAQLNGTKDDVLYGGELTIPQAEIYLPAILRLMGKMNVPEMPKPILIRELENISRDADSSRVEINRQTRPDNVEFDYFDNLKGRLRVKIPKNTWIKNEDMRIEISGDLQVIKNEAVFELFGSLEVVRGQYDLLGKTFIINEGSIVFEGGEEFIPRISINASYTFRNAQRARQELSVSISGTAESPEIIFSLDKNPISEGDALSYILFGKGMNELSINEQNNIAGSGGGSIAGKAAASVLSSQLSGFLTSKLNVDYIEVKSDGSFDNATVVVGKYITNDLFVSYEQHFGETDEKNLGKYQVKLEYELFRFLFLELNNSSNDSGFDAILKLEVE